MNYTAVTAIIFTFHHLSAILALVLAMVFSTIAYWLFFKRHQYRVLAMVITFITALIMGAMVAEKVFQQQPFGIEIVRAG